MLYLLLFDTLLVIQVQCELQAFCNITTQWLAKYEQIHHATTNYQFFIKSAGSARVRAINIEDSINQVKSLFALCCPREGGGYEYSAHSLLV